MVQIYFNNIFTNKNIKIFGNSEKKDHVYIEDLTKILADCLERRITGIINIASGQINSFYNIARFIKRLTKLIKKSLN